MGLLPGSTGLTILLVVAPGTGSGLAALGVRRLALVWAIQTEGDHSREVLIGRLCYGGVWVLATLGLRRPVPSGSAIRVASDPHGDTVEQVQMAGACS